MQTQPFFTNFDIKTYQTEFAQLLQTNRVKINTLLQSEEFTWDNLIHPMDELSNNLHIKWALLSHMHNVVDTEEVRNTYNNCLPLLTEYQSDLGQNKALYSAYQAISESNFFAEFTPEKRRTIANNLRDFHLCGVDLPEDKKITFRELEKKLAELTTRFEENVLDATHAWQKQITDIRLLAGLPEHVIAYAKNQAEQHGKDGWVLTLEMPCYLAVISYAENRELRQEIYTAFVTRASDLSDKKFDNSNIMQAILATRHELANLLDFSNYAELSLATKMLTQPSQVMKFLNELAALATPLAQKEFNSLQDFAVEVDAIDKLQPWDVAYYSEKLQKKLFDFNSEELRPYFPEAHVLKGLFSLVEQLYNIHIEPMHDIAAWHPDVKCFVIYNEKNHAIGYFYIDLYARPQKHGGAWMDDLCSRYQKLNGDLQLPVTFLTCNFTPPSKDQPSLLTHDDVLTLFHEFGHGLHHMLTKMDVLDISGISGVEWDAVELPSQFMENFCWEKSVLDKIACHYQTGEHLPEHLYNQLRASKNFQAAMQLVRQLEFALFDFRMHLEFKQDVESSFIQTILNNVRQQVCVVPVIASNRFQHSFSHIFAGGYAAGYYSYKWAEVLSSDVYELFAENGVISNEIGQRFLDTILSRGGSDNAMNLFKAFRGREPAVEALLKNSGLL
jgi:oligopeptidase A